MSDLDRTWLIGDWRNDPKYEALYALAVERFTRTESYDVRVCHGRPMHGLAMPFDSREMAMIGRNALNVDRDLRDLVAALGYTMHDLHKISSRLTWKDVEEHNRRTEVLDKR